MFAEIYDWVVVQIETNEVFAGVIGGSLLVSVLYYLREVPGKLWRLAKANYTTTLVVRSDDHGFFWINLWLSQREYAKRARRLKLTVNHNHESDKWDWTAAPGYGWHVFLHKGNLFIIVRDEPETTVSQRSQTAQTERLTVMTIGRGHGAIQGMIEEAKHLLDNRKGVAVHIWMGWHWMPQRNRVMRMLDTVVLPTEQTGRLIADVQRFIERRKWYGEHGIPYRRGYMFAGQPGTGKTSLAMALAGHFKREIFVLNLGSLADDEKLIEAMGEVSQDAVLLLEDIDAIHAAAVRTDESGEGHQSAITASALLNTIDGAMATEGRVLIMTSNHPERIDPALLRPGRVDVYETIGPLEPGDIARLFLKFYPEQDFLAEKIAREAVASLPAANVQNLCIVHEDNAAAAASAIIAETVAAEGEQVAA